ncbi:MAG TPA: TolC family protein, partial [Candidatus Krumholzibacteriaceae bacterium]|nr:TolC family protein [Candidatus Krumholzibacteriaceae bacterium]
MKIKSSQYAIKIFLVLITGLQLSVIEGVAARKPYSSADTLLTEGLLTGKNAQSDKNTDYGPVEAEGDLDGKSVDLTLEDALRLALNNDETLKEARQEIKAARADLLSAKAQRLPHLDIAGQYGRNIQKPAFFLPEAFQNAMNAPARVEMGGDNDFTCAATLTLNLWTAGRVSSAIEASSQAAEAMRYQQEAVEKLTSYRVKEAYYNVLLAEKRVRIAEKALSMTLEAARIARVGYERGSVSRFDKMRAETELANRKAPLAIQQNNLRQKMIILKKRCGVDYSTKITLADTLAATGTIPGIDYLLRVTLESSPEIKALRHRMNAGKYNLSMRKAQRWPMLQVSANYALQSQWSEDYFP